MRFKIEHCFLRKSVTPSPRLSFAVLSILSGYPLMWWALFWLASVSSLLRLVLHIFPPLFQRLFFWMFAVLPTATSTMCIFVFFSLATFCPNISSLLHYYRLFSLTAPSCFSYVRIFSLVQYAVLLPHFIMPFHSIRSERFLIFFLISYDR